MVKYITGVALSAVIAILVVGSFSGFEDTHNLYMAAVLGVLLGLLLN